MRYTDKCKCNDEAPKISGNHDVRVMLGNLKFNLVPEGEVVDRHNCHYVKTINALIPEACRLAHDEEMRLHGRVDYLGLQYFHRFIDKLAEAKGLRKPKSISRSNGHDAP